MGIEAFEMPLALGYKQWLKRSFSIPWGVDLNLSIIHQNSF
jgi:hypothetical protein